MGASTQSNPSGPAAPAEASGPSTRSMVAVAILLMVVVYAVSIITGWIPEQRKLAAPDAAILVVGILIASILLQPRLLDRLSSFELGSLKFDLSKVKEDQKNQQEELNDVRFALTLLVQEGEREHLKNLKTGNTQYEGSHNLRTELRRLETLGLISKIGEHKIGELKDGLKVDIKNIVKLEKNGVDYLRRIGEAGD
jgi:hypothetical protein